MKTLLCKNAGFDCDAVFKGNTEEDVLKQAAEHGMMKHGIAKITPDFHGKLKRLIRDEAA